jgi:hypothetical protein
MHVYNNLKIIISQHKSYNSITWFIHNFDVTYVWEQVRPSEIIHSVLRASPTVFSMWLQTGKFIVKKSKCAGLAQEIGFFLHQIRAACLGWWKTQHTLVHVQKKSVINWTWLQLSRKVWCFSINNIT